MAEKHSNKDINSYGLIDFNRAKKHEIESFIQEQNKRFQVICSSKNDAIITSDKTKRILFWNKGAEHIFGYSADEAIGQLLTLIIPDQLHHRHDKGMERMNQGKKPRVLGKVMELTAVKKSGEEFPIELTLGSWDNDGNRYYSGIIRDITEKKKAERIILDEKKKADELLLNILPKQVADELKMTGKATTKIYEHVSILFTGFADFKSMTSSGSSIDVVEDLHGIYSHFDDIVEALHVEKIETIGETYFAACGVPVTNTDHAVHCVEAAKQMLSYLENRNIGSEVQWKMRVGIHSGPVVAGVVGKKKFNYDLFGNSVNIASMMQAYGEVGKINVSDTTYEHIKGKYNCTPRGRIVTEGEGDLNMFFVE